MFISSAYFRRLNLALIIALGAERIQQPKGSARIEHRIMDRARLNGFGFYDGGVDEVVWL